MSSLHKPKVQYLRHNVLLEMVCVVCCFVVVSVVVFVLVVVILSIIEGGVQTMTFFWVWNGRHLTTQYMGQFPRKLRFAIYIKC